MMFQIFRSDLRRMLFSKKIWGAAFGSAFVCFLNLLQFHAAFTDSCSVLAAASQAPFFHVILLVLAAVPFSTAFCEDWDNRYIRCLLMRTSVRKYASSKVLCCFLGALLEGMLGLILLVIFTFPLTGKLGPEANDSFLLNMKANPTGLNFLFVHQQYLLWIVGTAAFRSLEGAVFAVFALLLSVKVTNVFITLAAPAVGYYVYLNMLILFSLIFFSLPDSLNMAIFESASLNSSTLLNGILLALVPCFLFYLCFTHAVRRKLENG